MDKYQVTRVLGEGAFGKVLEARNQIESGARVAIKQIKANFKSWDECKNLRELKALKNLRHVHIVRLREMILEKGCLYFVFEFVTSDLAKFCDRRKRRNEGPVPLGECQRIMHELLDGLAFMHKNGFFHRDVKPDNLLCDEDGGRLKIADFGLARELRSRPPYTNYVSTRWYRAPEVILGDPAYSSPVDLWACGAILAEMITLSPILPGTSAGDQMSRTVNLVGALDTWPEGSRLAQARQPPLRVPRTKPTSFVEVLGPELGHSSLGHLCSTLMQLDPSSRPSAWQALQQPFFHGYRSSSSGGAEASSTKDEDSAASSSSALPAPSAHGNNGASRRIEEGGHSGGEGGSSSGMGRPKRLLQMGSNSPFSPSSAASGVDKGDGMDPLEKSVDLAADIDHLLGGLGLDSPKHKSQQQQQHAINISSRNTNTSLPPLRSNSGNVGDASSSSQNGGSGSLLVAHPAPVPSSLEERRGGGGSKSKLDDLLNDLDEEMRSPAPSYSRQEGFNNNFDEAFGSNDLAVGSPDLNQDASSSSSSRPRPHNAPADANDGAGNKAAAAAAGIGTGTGSRPGSAAAALDRWMQLDANSSDDEDQEVPTPGLPSPAPQPRHHSSSSASSVGGRKDAGDLAAAPPVISQHSPPRNTPKDSPGSRQHGAINNNSNNGSYSSTTSKVTSRSGIGSFSESELAALVAAVELYPVAAGLDRNVRWRKIAAQVGGGHSKKECFEAFRDYCQMLKEKRNAREQRLAERARQAADNDGSDGYGQANTASGSKSGANCDGEVLSAAERRLESNGSLPSVTTTTTTAAKEASSAPVYLGAHHAQHVRRSEQFAPPPTTQKPEAAMSTSIEVEDIEEFGSM